MDSGSIGFGPIPGFDEKWEECASRIDAHWNDVLITPGNIFICTHGVVVNYLHEKIFGSKLASRGRDVPFASGFSISLPEV